MKINKHFFFLFFSIVAVSFTPPTNKLKPPFLTADNKWADSVFNSLTPDERIAQLFMVAAYSNRDQTHIDEISILIKDYKIGGLIFFQGGPVRQAIHTNLYQSISKVPLLISIDGEWGLAMRLDSTVQFPHQMTLGAIQNDSLIYEMGAEIARQCKRMGIHVNLAPVVDINSNPKNPIIGNRSFGEDKFNVARKGLAYMKGMQDAGIMANAKHFPGHGDTESDSHKTLPVINHPKERIDTLELYPFKELIKEGLGSMMVAHLYIPAYDSTENRASTLSKNVVSGLLKDSLQFQGLIFTDALNMKGVSAYYKPGIVDVKALIAGNDVLLFAEDVPTAISEIKKAIDSGEISQAEIDIRCKKILAAKQWAGLNNYQPIKLENLYEDLNTANADLINRKLTENSITLLSNKNDLIPLKKLDTLNIASLSIGSKNPNTFQTMLANYNPVQHFNLEQDTNKEKRDSILKKLEGFNLIIVSINNTRNSKNFALTRETMDLLDSLKKQSKIIIDVFANPYTLSKFDNIKNADALIMSYEDNDYSESLSAQLIFGGIPAKGKLPVTASPYFKIEAGIQTEKPIRFKYTIPEDANINSYDLAKIDTIALKGIQEKAYPGCQILVAKNGMVIYRKSFGWHTYENKIAVKNDDIYDLASITKIAATVPAVMKLVDKQKISFDDQLYCHLENLKRTNKENIIIREMLAHQAGLQDWIPFWQKTITKGNYNPGIYSPMQNDTFPYRVAENLYIRKDYPDTIIKAIVNSKVNDKNQYKYSDLGYYFLKQIIELKTNQPLNNYVQKNFYAPLGLSTMGYHPRERFDLNRIIPTEYDVNFRKQLIHGDVHDQGAAMLGGVAGHAGVFSNANDLAVLMQMYLQKGSYGGEKYLDSTTVNECIKCQYCINENRRGIGFDKPETNPDKESPVCTCVSYLSFGHSGFTGTLAWADPDSQLIYIFLSNRIYPDATINKLVKMNIRSSIQEVIYGAVR